MRTVARFLVLAGVGLLLSGCLSVGQIARRGTTVDEGIGNLSNRAILINLARASRNEPLYFLSVTQVQGTGSTDLHLITPSFAEGPSLKGTAKDFAFSSSFLDNTLSTQVQMAAPYTKDFYNGIMSPLGLDDVNLLLHQGFPRELVYYLAIDHAKFTSVDHPEDSFVVYNDPELAGTDALLPPKPGTPPNFAQFGTVMQLAMTAGFTTEVTPPPDCSSTAVPTGQQETDEHVKACNKPEPAQQVAGQVSNGAVQFILQPKSDKASGVRLCFERTMAVGEGLTLLGLADRESTPQRRPIYCGLEGERGGKQVILIPPRLYKIEISTRSIYGIFHYLGRAMAPDGQIPQLLDFHVPGEESPTGPILVISADVSDCFSATRYGDQQYCVPNGPSGETTRQIFTMLNTLVALKQAPGDLPIANTVVVAP